MCRASTDATEVITSSSASSAIVHTMLRKENMRVPETMQARAEDRKRRLELLDPDEWIMEKKLDGYRLLVVGCDPDAADPSPHGYSRAGNDQLIEERTPHIFADLDDLLPSGYTVLDGEMSTEDDDFKHVSSVMKSSPEKAVEKQHSKHLEYVVFDVLWWDGVDLRDRPQHERRTFLETNLPLRTNFVRLTETFPLSRDTIINWQSAGGEGAILKNRNAQYVCGKRPLDTWLKIKAIDDADVVVMGYTAGQGKYEGQVGAVQFGQYRDGTLVQRGQTSGMTDALRLELSQNGDQYVGQVMVVQHMGIDKDRGGFRHPQFKGFRDDKHATDCVWD